MGKLSTSTSDVATEVNVRKKRPDSKDRDLNAMNIGIHSYQKAELRILMHCEDLHHSHAKSFLIIFPNGRFYYCFPVSDPPSYAGYVWEGWRSR